MLIHSAFLELILLSSANDWLSPHWQIFFLLWIVMSVVTPISVLIILWLSSLRLETLRNSRRKLKKSELQELILKFFSIPLPKWDAIVIIHVQKHNDAVIIRSHVVKLRLAYAVRFEIIKVVLMKNLSWDVLVLVEGKLVMFGRTPYHNFRGRGTTLVL